MTAISFSVFKEKLLSGEKTQTIRKLDITRLEQMNRLGIQVYWKQRTKESEKLFDAKLKSVRVIQFNQVGIPENEAIVDDYFAPVPIEGYPTKQIWADESLELAHKDGFATLHEMAVWFREKYGRSLIHDDVFGLPVYFMVIEWVRD